MLFRYGIDLEGKRMEKNEKYYTFDNEEELLEKVDVKKVFEDNYDDFPFDEFWADEVVGNFEDVLDFFGFIFPETNWTTPNSKEQGASFVGKWSANEMNKGMLESYYGTDKVLMSLFSELEKLVKKNKLSKGEVIAKRDEKHTFKCVLYNEEGDDVNDDKVVEKFCSICKKLNDWFYDKLQEEFNNVTSPERLAYQFVINEIKISEKYLKNK